MTKFEPNISPKFRSKNFRTVRCTFKPTPICMGILSGARTKDIFQTAEQCYLKISVELFKISAVYQCHLCRHFCVRSSNSGNFPSLRKILRRTSIYRMKKYTRTNLYIRKLHMKNYCGYQSYTQVADDISKTPLTNLLI